MLWTRICIGYDSLFHSMYGYADYIIGAVHFGHFIFNSTWIESCVTTS